MNQKILLIEDNPDLNRTLGEQLEGEGFQICSASDGEKGLELAARENPELILLDLIVPNMSGLEFCRKIKNTEKGKNIPIVIMTGLGEEIDEVLALELGADDYIKKPFGMRPLMARIRSILRRNKETPAPIKHNTLRAGSISMDLDHGTVVVGQTPVKFTKSEFKILSALISEPNKSHSRKDLLELLGDEGGALVERNIDVHVGIIRRKLGDEGKIIETVRSEGYRCSIKNN